MFGGSAYVAIKSARNIPSHEPKCKSCNHNIHTEPCKKIIGIFHKRKCLCTHSQQETGDSK